MKLQDDSLRQFLNELVIKYEHPGFIELDPISIPHRYTNTADIEISGLFAAVFSWGQRKTIINKTRELMSLMGDRPFDFILHHSEKDLKQLIHFKHRTFQATDLLYFIHFLKYHYSNHPTLEYAFIEKNTFQSLEHSLNYFRNYFFSLNDFPKRTTKHVSHPISGSTCKRLCMYLRWMVRNNKRGVDFGIWRTISPSDLKMPLDVHVHRVGIQLGLLRVEKPKWNTVLELTSHMKIFDPFDPVKYDFALFNLGVTHAPLL